MRALARNVRRHRAAILWIALAIPGLLQLGLLAIAVAGRLAYPFDLEWMEGGTLAHAWRLVTGEGIYVAPSVDFIPFLYTPLYPGLLAALEPVFGISYLVARCVSVLALVAIIGLAFLSLVGGVRSRERWPAACGAALACGFMAATYPWVEGWYDIARADTLFLAMVLAGLVALHRWARRGSGWRGHARVGLAAAILALAFFCKQTGVLYVAAGGCVLLALCWRRVPVYVAVSGAIGLGGTWIGQRITGGWFWTYIFQVHQAHHTNLDRFVQSFDNILGHFPVVTAVISGALVIVPALRLATRERNPSSQPFYLWTFIFAVSCVVGALGWSTQWAHFNAYIPAMVTGGLAAGAAIPALVGALTTIATSQRPWARALVAASARLRSRLRGSRRHPTQVAPASSPPSSHESSPAPSPLAPAVIAALVAIALGAQLLSSWWRPRRFIPTDADRAAGQRLVERIRAMDGDVFMPFHPWYPHLAGKPIFVHRMGVLDVSYVRPGKRAGRAPGEPPPWPVAGLAEAFAERRFSAIIWDDRPIDPYFHRLRQGYRVDQVIPRDERPRLYTGARAVPREIWRANTPAAPPDGVTVLWDFESGTLEGWTADGTAWGLRPASRPLPGQATVGRYQGTYYLSSMHGGDRALGVIRSPPFTIQGSRLTLLLSGGRQPDNLRAELHVGDQIVYSATGQNNEYMDTIEWDVSAHRGQEARVVLHDQSSGSWGHLNADELWEWR